MLQPSPGCCYCMPLLHNHLCAAKGCAFAPSLPPPPPNLPLIMPTCCNLQTHSCQLRLRVTVRYCACAVRACNSKMCVRLWRQFFIAEVTSNRILDWTSILQRKGQGGSKSFTEINILFVRYCVFYLPDQVKSEWLYVCGMNDHPSFFQRQRSELAPSRPPVS